MRETELALELQLLNFKEGESDFTGVFVLQGDLAAKQDQLAAAQGAIVTSLIGVYKALGGGWEIRLTDHHQPQRIPEFDLAPPREELPTPHIPAEAVPVEVMPDDES